jgi:HlyD family secretion protein
MAPAVHRRGNILPGCILLAALAACQPAESEDPLRLVEVARRDVVVTATAAGVVEPITTVEVKSQASGVIVDVLVVAGDPVTEGLMLVRVDPRIPHKAVDPATADSAVAHAELQNAEAQLTRSEELHHAKAITDQELEQARLAQAGANAALIRARRTLEDAKIALEDTEVRAPGPGVILGRAVEGGSVIASASRDVGGGAVLLRMAMLDTVQVRALVDETDIGLIEPGTPVTIQVASFPTRRFDGVVERIGIEAVAEQNVTMVPVLVRIANRERLLRPGMNAEVQVHVGEELDVLAVPNAALRPLEDALVIARELDIPTGEGEAGELPYPPDSVLSPASTGPRPPGRRGASGQDLAVFVMRDGVPQMLRVRSGLTDFDFTAVEGELQVGDSVLILPTLGLLEELEGREEWARRRAGGGLGGNR